MLTSSIPFPGVRRDRPLAEPGRTSLRSPRPLRGRRTRRRAPRPLSAIEPRTRSTGATSPGFCAERPDPGVRSHECGVALWRTTDRLPSPVSSAAEKSSNLAHTYLTPWIGVKTQSSAEVRNGRERADTGRLENVASQLSCGVRYRDPRCPLSRRLRIVSGPRHRPRSAQIATFAPADRNVRLTCAP